jgi:hypothetical protein
MQIIIILLLATLVISAGVVVGSIKRHGFSSQGEGPVKDPSRLVKFPDPPAWYKDQCTIYYCDTEDDLSQKEDIFGTKQVEDLLDGRWTADKK